MTDFSKKNIEAFKKDVGKVIETDLAQVMPEAWYIVSAEAIPLKGINQTQLTVGIYLHIPYKSNKFLNLSATPNKLFYDKVAKLASRFGESISSSTFSDEGLGTMYIYFND